MSEKQHTTLLKLQQIIKSRLEQAMPLPCWVTAEISELKVNYSGHCYMELVEKGGANQVPCARASAVVWRSNYGAISSYFRSATGSDLSEGMNVLMKVSVSYHELYGLSLVVSDIDPLYTLGDMQRQRMLTIQRLEQEGVMDMNRSLELPVVVQRIAVVSSRNAAGYQDFMNELSSSPYSFTTELFDSFMQGHAAEESVISALDLIATRAEQFDAVVMIRGGGSQSDLAAFDSYRLCCHIAQFPLPVITGIGHDKDQSVADLVAALSLKTPTAVAGWLIETAAQLDAWFSEARAQTIQSAVDILDAYRRQLQAAAGKISSVSSGFSRGVEAGLIRLAARLEQRIGTMQTTAANKLENLETAMRLKTKAVLLFQNQRLHAAGQMTASKQPDKILALGFAIVRKDGAAVKSASEVIPGDRLEITLSDGRISAQADRTDAHDSTK